jgi:hypothetical protein
MIDEEEAWLEGRIGPLTGERTETFYLGQKRLIGTVDAVYLSRRTDAVDFASDGTTLVLDTDYRLLNGYVLETVNGGAVWGDILTVIYTPTDEVVVKGIIYDLLRYRQVQANLQAVRIGEYSESYFSDRGSNPVFLAMLRKVLPSAGLGAYASPFRLARTARDRSFVEATGS